MNAALKTERPVGRLTDADHAEIYRLGTPPFNWGSYRIANAIGKHPSTVAWFMYSEGLRAPRKSPDEPTSYVRNGRRVHRFTDEEDVFIQALRIQGFGFPKIAELATKRYSTNRSAHVVQCRLIMLAAREDAGG